MWKPRPRATAGGGGWLPWLAQNFEGSTRTAQDYMKMADEWAANAQRAAHFDPPAEPPKTLPPDPEGTPRNVQAAPKLPPALTSTSPLASTVAPLSVDVSTRCAVTASGLRATPPGAAAHPGPYLQLGALELVLSVLRPVVGPQCESRHRR